jgi:methyl-accepting chemotaxis protein
MDSRAIDTSLDSNAAAPFVQNMMRQFAEMQQVADAWKADAIASQQSNVEELADRIDQFVRFRTELLRPANERTAAARATGENDANRWVGTLLNNTLHTLARGYEQEIARARARVEVDQRYLLEILWALAVLGAAALGGGLARRDGASSRGVPHDTRRTPEPQS